MNPTDGRVVSNFVIQALKELPLTIYGNSEETRSFKYIHDVVDRLIKGMNGDCKDSIYLEKPHEYIITEFAKLVQNMQWLRQ